MEGTQRAPLVAYAVAAVLLVVGGAYLLRGGGSDAPAPASGGGVALDGARPEGTGARREAGDGPLFVHVAGAVRRPGIYRVPAGSRVAVAVRRAGGLTSRADLTAFNLASGLRDAQQVIVPPMGEGGPAAPATAPGPAGAASTGEGGGAPGGGKRISLARATPEQLDSLEGIGPKLAAKIIAYRNEHRGFRSVDELREVDGIGEKRLAALRNSVQP